MSGETKLVIFVSLLGMVCVLLLVGLAVIVLLVQEAGPEAPAPTQAAAGAQSGGPSPTFVVLSTLPPSPTVTNTPPPTDTPPPTATAQPTDTPPPSDTPRPTNPPPPPPTNPPPAPASMKGLTASFNIEGGRTQFGVGEQIWFSFTINNPTTTAVSYGRLGVAVEENGQNASDLYHTSYSETTLRPGEVFNWRDALIIPRPGTFVLRLSICYPNVATCSVGGEWEYLSAGVTVTVQ